MQHSLPSHNKATAQLQAQEQRFTYEPLLTGSPIGGAFFFLIGLIGVVLQGTLMIFDLGSLSDVSKLGEKIFLFYSFIFMIAGGSILFYKKKYIFDRLEQTLFPLVHLPFMKMQMKKISYKNIDAVQISRIVTGSGANVGLIFTLNLVQDEHPDIRLEKFFRYQNAKRIGELLSLALRKPLHDMSSGRMVVKQPGEFKTSLRERLLTYKDISEEPLRPSDMEAYVREHAGEMQVRIPPFGLLDSLFTLLIPALVLFFFFSWVSFLSLQTLPFEIIAYSLTVPTVFIVIAGSYLFRNESIDIDSEKITIHWHFSGFSGTNTIPLKDLEGLYVMGREDEDERLHFLKALTRSETDGRRKDIFYPFRCLSSSIIARAGNESVHFGRSLDIEELIYLVYLIETFLKDGDLRSVK